MYYYAHNFWPLLFGANHDSNLNPLFQLPKNNSPYNEHLSVDEIDETEFVKRISYDSTASALNYSQGKFLKFEKIEKEYVEAPILFTEAVYEGLKSTFPNHSTLTNGHWRQQETAINDYTGKVYGGGTYWKNTDKLQ